MEKKYLKDGALNSLLDLMGFSEEIEEFFRTNKDLENYWFDAFRNYIESKVNNNDEKIIELDLSTSDGLKIILDTSQGKYKEKKINFLILHIFLDMEKIFKFMKISSTMQKKNPGVLMEKTIVFYIVILNILSEN